MAAIEGSIKYVLDNEGGWTIDDGGWTMWGIVVSDVAAYRNVPASSITEQDMKNLSVSEATAIYKKQYWDALNLDQVNDQNMATCIFDTGVNRGISVSAKYAQRVCNISGATLQVDGKIGPLSLIRINQMNRTIFIRNYEAMEMAGYEAILASNPSKYGIYRNGWESRARRLLTLV